MAEGGPRPTSAVYSSAFNAKPVPMKLFSTWEIDKSTPSCIPRLCTLTLTRLVVNKQLEPDLQSVIIAIKMQSSKRILRSNEILIPPNGLLDTELDLTFSLQYPHFLKREGNQLQVLLQRRKKYKNRTILGYKTFAAGRIDMSQVLQKAVDQDMLLYAADVKDQSSPVAQVTVQSLCSQPVDHDDRRSRTIVDPDRSPGELSDDDDVMRYEQDFSSNDDLSDIEPLPGDDDRPSHLRKSRAARSSVSSRQRNLKQKFVALLRRFKVSEEVLESVQELGARADVDPNYVDNLFDEVDNLSDSDIDMDNISVRSTPKPTLTPFFGGSTSNVGPYKPNSSLEADKSFCGSNSSPRIESQGNTEPTLSVSATAKPDAACVVTPHGMRRTTKAFVRRQVSSPLTKHRSRFVRHKSFSSHEQHHHHHQQRQAAVLPLSSRQAAVLPLSSAVDVRKPRRCSTSFLDSTPRRSLMDQVSAILNSGNSLPDCIVLINSREWHAQIIAQALQSASFRAICTCSAVDVRTVMSAVVNKIQKVSSKSTSSMLPMKIAVVGGDGYIASVLKPYVDLFSSKSPEWLGFVRFLLVPFGVSTIAKHVARLDSRYSSLFNDTFWKEAVVFKVDSSSRFDVAEVASRIIRYLSTAGHVIQLPLAEIIITNRDKCSDDSSQIIVPFVGEVRMGPMDGGNNSTVQTLSDQEEVLTSPLGVASGSPPHVNHGLDRSKDTPSTSTGGTRSKDTPSTSSGGTRSRDTPSNSTAGNRSKDTPSSSTGGTRSKDPPSTTASGPLHIPANPVTSGVTSSVTSGGSPMSSNMQLIHSCPTPPSAPAADPSASDSLDLQVEYWMTAPRSEAAGSSSLADKSAARKDVKCSLKTAFRSMRVFRMHYFGAVQPASGAADTPAATPVPPALSMVVVTREKKQKIMRLKKIKEPDTKKSQQIDGISRLICTSKSQSHPLSVSVDGVDWNGVKFFQLSAQWQSHVKYFPVYTFGISASSDVMSPAHHSS